MMKQEPARTKNLRLKPPGKRTKTYSVSPHDPETPIEQLAWIKGPQLTGLKKLGVRSMRDLLEHYPRRHEDRRRFDNFPDDENGGPLCLSGTVGKTIFRRFGRMRSFEAEIEETPSSVLSRRLTLRWFNLFHVQKTVVSGSRIIAYGRPRLRGKRLVIEHPEFEIVTDEDCQSIHLDRIVPIHAAGSGISVRMIRMLIHRALAETDWNCWRDPLNKQPINWGLALRTIHFPEDLTELECARRELSLRELLGLQTLVTIRKNETRKPKGTPKKPPGNLLNAFLNGLPFLLTTAQQNAIHTIRMDMEKSSRMHRLLQGDVGSGKTVVAVSAILLSLEAGCDAVLMAPTQILAEQHYRNFLTWLNPLGIQVELRTGATKKTNFPYHKKHEKASVIIGTHTLLHNQEIITGAGLVVIDEQHKFGVVQRTKLSNLASSPDMLVMTATPIPRTLAQTIYGDLDLSILDERPPGRGILRTVARGKEKLPEIITYLLGQLKKGRQAFIVYPLVEESDKLSAKAAETEIALWRERLTPHSCSLLHGRMNAEQKESAMNSFHMGYTQVLVTTSVIEVGIDIPNATVLLVENAERFGLAQLHQLRGRIGRGVHSSICILVEGSGNSEAIERLRILEMSNDGFVIAEEDLRLRGAGDIIGTEQSGHPPLRIADLYRDADLICLATMQAERILAEDPNLILPQHNRLRKMKDTFTSRFIALGD